MQSGGIHTIQLQGQTFHLHPFRALYWAEASALLMADLHLGKTTHFRRSGIAVPAAVRDANWERLAALLIEFRPQKVFFLGDLFHSDHNFEWNDFQELTAQFHHISFGLVLGNHDRLEEHHYRGARLSVWEEPLAMEPFLLSHHPLENVPEGAYNLAGHIHPGARLRGPGRQRLRMPCFHFGRQVGLLPAFGAFTGMGVVEIRAGDRVFVIAEGQVLPVPH